jgi:hypothetical protein
MRTARGLAASVLLAGLLGGCAMSGEPGPDRWDSDLAPAILTTPDIAQDKVPVLWVVHQPYPYGWAFLPPSGDIGPRPAMISKEEALRIDPSLEEIRRLPVGWQARRNSVQDKWTLSPWQGLQ